MRTPEGPDSLQSHDPKQGQRHALAAGDLTDAEAALIEAAEIPAEHRYSLDDEPA